MCSFLFLSKHHTDIFNNSHFTVLPDEIIVAICFGIQVWGFIFASVGKDLKLFNREKQKFFIGSVLSHSFERGWTSV